MKYIAMWLFVLAAVVGLAIIAAGAWGLYWYVAERPEFIWVPVALLVAIVVATMVAAREYIADHEQK